MNQQTNAPQISKTNLDRPNPGDTDVSLLIARQETPDSLQANDAEKMTPDEANELSADEEE